MIFNDLLYWPHLPLPSKFSQRLKHPKSLVLSDHSVCFAADSSAFALYYILVSLYKYLWVPSPRPGTITDHGHTPEGRDGLLSWNAHTGKVDTQRQLPEGEGGKEQKQNNQIKTVNFSTFCLRGPPFPVPLTRKRVSLEPFLPATAAHFQASVCPWFRAWRYQGKREQHQSRQLSA